MASVVGRAWAQTSYPTLPNLKNAKEFQNGIEGNQASGWIFGICHLPDPAFFTCLFACNSNVLSQSIFCNANCSAEFFQYRARHHSLFFFSRSPNPDRYADCSSYSSASGGYSEW